MKEKIKSLKRWKVNLRRKLSSLEIGRKTSSSRFAKLTSFKIAGKLWNTKMMPCCLRKWLRGIKKLTRLLKNQNHLKSILFSQKCRKNLSLRNFQSIYFQVWTKYKPLKMFQKNWKLSIQRTTHQQSLLHHQHLKHQKCLQLAKILECVVRAQTIIFTLCNQLVLVILPRATLDQLQRSQTNKTKAICKQLNRGRSEIMKLRRRKKN